MLLGQLAGCAANKASSFEDLSVEVHSAVKKQMPLTQAQRALENLNFKCMQGTSLDKNKNGVVECSRNKGGFLYGCIHRVWLEVSITDSKISNIQIHQPVCAGL